LVHLIKDIIDRHSYRNGNRYINSMGLFMKHEHEELGIPYFNYYINPLFYINPILVKEDENIFSSKDNELYNDVRLRINKMINTKKWKRPYKDSPLVNISKKKYRRLYKDYSFETFTPNVFLDKKTGFLVNKFGLTKEEIDIMDKNEDKS
jgi:hypothetical protein